MTTVSSEINPIEHTPDNSIRTTTDVEVFTELAGNTERPQAPNNSGRHGLGIPAQKMLAIQVVPRNPHRDVDLKSDRLNATPSQIVPYDRIYSFAICCVICYVMYNCVLPSTH